MLVFELISWSFNDYLMVWHFIM